jgi:hypothetical protein
LKQNGNFSRRLLLAVDAKGYGYGDDRQQHAFQAALVSALGRAADRAGLARSTWNRDGLGDGEFAVLPSTEPEPLVVDGFVRELNDALADHNRYLMDEARLRLRVAIHYGVAIPADNGFSGQGVVVVNRLVDSGPARDALVLADRANVAVIVSQRVFDDTVVQGHTTLRVQDFRKVLVRNKEFTEEAWLRVPGEDVHALSLAEEPTPLAGSSRPAVTETGSEAERTVQRITNDLHGPVSGRNINFGFVNEQR